MSTDICYDTGAPPSDTVEPATLQSRAMRHWYEIVRAAAKAQRLTYKAIALRMDRSTATVGHWLTGVREPKLVELRQLADIVGLGLGEALGDDVALFLPKDERELVELLRALTPSQREAATGFLRSMVRANPPPVPEPESSQ